MKKLWESISYLGLTSRKKTLGNKATVINNQMNFIMLLVMIFVSCISFTEAIVVGGKNFLSLGYVRVHIIILSNIFNLTLAYFGYHKISKISLIFLPTLFFIIMPSYVGYAEEESFFYYPIVLLAFSIIPQLTLHLKNDKHLIIGSLIFFTLLTIFIDNLILAYTDQHFNMAEAIEPFYLYYKLVPVLVLIFIHSAIYYLRRINFKYENELLGSNEKQNAIIEELTITQQHLIQSEKMAALGTLTSGIAHEINNPLNYIQYGTHIINDLKSKAAKDLKPTEEYQEAVDVINKGVNRISKIVSSLKVFTYKGDPVLKNTEISELINNILLLLRPNISHDIQVIKDYRLKGKVPVYPEKIQQVIVNILDNAIHAVEDTPRIKSKLIKVKTEEDDKYANIIISNTGQPIPKENIHQIFDPFFTTKDPDKGTGLGLSISYTLINEHKGKIFAKNLEDGVAFIIKLPLGKKGYEVF